VGLNRVLVMYIIRTFRGFLGVKDRITYWLKRDLGFLGVKDRITYWLKRDLGFLGVKEAEDTKKGGFLI